MNRLTVISLRKSGRAMCRVVTAVIAFLPIFLSSPAAAQDANYWSIAYGPVGQLLGGIVIGSARDLSATYYNPGGLILIEDPDFLISVEALEREKLRIKTTGSATSLDLSATRTGGAPSIVAGTAPWAGPGSRIAWSYLPRFDMNFNANEHRTFEGGSGVLLTEAVLTQKLSESWFGATWAHGLGEGLGLGVTGYVAYRSYRYRREFNAQQDSAGALGATALIVDNTRYSHYRLLAKIGAAMERGPLQLGLTVTTPSLGLFGSGDIGFTRSVTGIDLDGDLDPDNYLARGYDDDLDADYSSAWAIGAGGSWLYQGTRLHLSAEWYRGVSSEVLHTDPFSPGQGLADIVLDLDAEFDDVLNVGVGLEQQITPHTSLYGAFSFDPSALATPYDSRFAVAQWDLYHLTVGAATRIHGSRVTAGLGYTWGGTDEYDLYRRFYPQSPTLAPVESDLRYSRLTLLIGFEI